MIVSYDNNKKKKKGEGQLRTTSAIGSVSLKTNELMNLLPVVSKITRQYYPQRYITLLCILGFGLFHGYYDQKDTVKSNYESFRADWLIMSQQQYSSKSGHYLRPTV